MPSEQYKAFSTVVTQKDIAETFTEFTVALRSFEETVKFANQANSKDDSIYDVYGQMRKDLLKNALDFPSYKQDQFVRMPQ